MKKKVLLFAAIIALCFSGNFAWAQPPSWLWARGAGGIDYDAAYSVATDAAGNVYMAGYFGSTSITFGTTTLINADNSLGSDDVFLVKYDINGTVVWAKSAGGTDYDDAYSVAVDGQGNIYLVGIYYSPTITFGSFTLTNAGSENMFLVKYDNNGGVIWAQSAGGTGNDEAFSVAVSISGNAYLTGWFSSPSITFGATTITNTNSGYYDVFLAKYNTDGTVAWAKSAAGSDDDKATSVAVDASGNACISGWFDSPSITFGMQTLTNTASDASSDIFLTKYDTDGNVIWARSATGSNYDYSNAVAADPSGNFYLAGCFESPSFTIGTTTLTNPGYSSIFLAKYGAAGNYLWARTATGTDDDEATSVAVDASGWVYVAGLFFSPGLTFGTTTLNNTDNTGGNADIFLAGFDDSGNSVWAKAAGSADDYDIASSIALNPGGNIYMAGYFYSSALSFGSTTLTNASAGSDDIFLAKTASVTVGINKEATLPETISVFPNPADRVIKIIKPANSKIEILNAEGQIVGSFNAESVTAEVDLGNLSSGVYYIKATMKDGISVKRFVKQ